MRVVLRAMLTRRRVEATTSAAERVTRRNVTFSPRNGTRIRTSRRVGGRRLEEHAAQV